MINLKHFIPDVKCLKRFVGKTGEQWICRQGAMGGVSLQAARSAVGTRKDVCPKLPTARESYTQPTTWVFSREMNSNES